MSYDKATESCLSVEGQDNIIADLQKEHNIASNKGLYIKTYGCQSNVYDSGKMVDLLRSHGFHLVDSPNLVDMVIVNTCHIRHKAAEKLYSELGKIALVKQEKKENGADMIVVVAGCTAQAEGEEIKKRSSCVDAIVGTASYHLLPVMLEELKRTKSLVTRLEFDYNNKFDALVKSSSSEVAKSSSFLSIQEGCDKFCHFCCVPYTRGPEYSRPVSDIYREAMELVHKGAKEITILGQNVSAYHGIGEKGKECSLGGLIKRLATIPGLKRLRYTTSHPGDMIDEELFEAHAQEEKLMPYLHLPVQSGSDSILKAMNRKHTVKDYLNLIAKFRQYRPDLALSSDFIVGYPGETEEDFQDTLALVEAVSFAQAYSFKYSKRPGTSAFALSNQIDEEIKEERLARLQEKLRKQQLAFNQSKVGEIMEILIEKEGRKPGQIIGKSPYLQSVVVTAPSTLIGEIITVRITAAQQNSVRGELC